MVGRPERVQLSNARNYRIPDKTTRVHRGTEWQNPYWVERGADGQPLLLGPGGEIFNDAGFDSPTTWANVHARAVELFRRHVATIDVSALRGRNLACWCPLDYPDCHADVLLERANRSVAAPGKLL